MFAATFTGGDNSSGKKLKELTASTAGLANIPYDDSECWQAEVAESRITLAQQRKWNTPQSKLAKGIVQHPPTNSKIIAWARIDNREEIKKQLPEDLHDLCKTDEGVVLAAYLKWQVQTTSKLVGDFAFAIYDGRDNSVYCGRDHLGVRPFYYYFDGKQFVVASSLAVLNQLPLDLSLSEQWLARYIVSRSEDWQETVYTKIKKLPPAHQLKFKDEKISLQRYFDFSYDSDLILGSDKEYVDAYREILDQAMACRALSDYPVGSESSGGLDSSTVTALTSRFMARPGKDLHAFGYDEAEYTSGCIISVSQTNPVAMTHFVSHTRGGSDEDIVERFRKCHGAPSEHSNGISHHMFYEVAEQLGIRTLLSGFGGDEFVTNAAPIALVEFWRNKQLGLFLSRQRGKLLKPFHTARWLYQYYRYDNHSQVSRNLAEVMLKNWQLKLLSDEIADKHNLQSRVVRKDIYDGEKNTQNEFMLDDRWSPNVTARLENCTLMAASYGIDYRWPLLDIRLLKFYFSTPPEQKLGPAMMGRYLHRRAVANVLPEFITWKQKDMAPFKFWERLKLWIERTPLGKIFKRQQEKVMVKKADVQVEDKQPDFKLHPVIEPMINQDKLKKMLAVLRSPVLNQDQRRIRRMTIMQLSDLNSWLNNTRD